MVSSDSQKFGLQLKHFFFFQITSALGRESRETTLRNARKKIEALAHQVSTENLNMPDNTLKVQELLSMTGYELKKYKH